MNRESIYKNYIPALKAEHEIKGGCFWFIFSLDKLLVENNDHRINIPFANSLEELNIIPVRKQYLGTFKGHPCYSVEVSQNTAEFEGMSLIGLRELYGLVEEDMFLLAGKALQIVNWDKTHQYCGSCGAGTYTLEGERAKKCPKCGHLSYPVICPAVITAVIKDDKILMAHNRNFKGNMYGLIAGFVEAGETLEECVAREIKEEVGLKVKDIKYLGSQPWPFPNSLMLGFTAQYESGEIEVDGVEIDDAKWFDVNTLPNLPSEISIARKIIDWYIDKFKVQ
jgi:NAD+ diphosphatase